MALTQDQIGRYSRHLLLPEVGVEGQEKICNARVLCIGTGGLGSPAALYLAAAGVGTLGLIDFDVVDFSNLQRQIAHGESTVGQLKVDSAQSRLKDINSSVEVMTYNIRLSSENALEIIKDYDIVLDGTDNFPTRYLANDACVLLGKPYIYGCILKFDGLFLRFWWAGLWFSPPCQQGRRNIILSNQLKRILFSRVTCLRRNSF